jgi:hypothetical protein
MGLKLKFSGALFHCGRCRKSYSNPFGHVCVVRNPRGRVRVKPRASASLAVCGKCGKPYSNPLGHVCIVKTDFRKRAARAGRRTAAEAKRKKKPVVVRVKKKRAASGKPRQVHDYRKCRDADCTRVACIAYREGIERGAEMAGED